MAKQQSFKKGSKEKIEHKESGANLSLGDLEEFIKRQSEEESPVEYVILHDPLWSPALSALQQKGDINGIAELLKKSSPPDWVAKEIGIMMQPPKGYRGLVIKVDARVSQNARKNAENQIKELIDLRNKIVAAGGNENLEAAIAEVMQAENKSRAHLYKAWGFYGKKRTLRSVTLLGYVE